MSLKPPVPPTPLIPTPESDYVLRARLPINVDDYADIPTANAVALSSGRELWFGPTTYAIDRSWMPLTLNHDNVIWRGVKGKTKLVFPAATSVQGVVAGYTATSSIWRNIHIRDIIFDCSLMTDQTTGVLFGAVEDFSMIGCQVIGSAYPITTGGTYHNPRRGLIHDNRVTFVNGAVAGYGFALVGQEQVLVHGNWVYGPSTFDIAVLAFDVEPNWMNDTVSGTVIANNYFVRVNGGVVQAGSGTDPDRLSGVEVIDNHFIDCGGLQGKLPRMVIRGNKWIWRKTSAYPVGYFPSGTVSLSRAVNVGIQADDCIVEGNTSHNMHGTTVGAAVTLDDVRRCRVRNNTITDDNRPSNTTWAVEERQVTASVLSGFVAGTPSSMSIPVSAGVLQQAAAGSTVSHAAQTATIPTAAAYDRIDRIVVSLSAGAVSVIQGLQAPFSDITPAAATCDDSTQLSIATVYVPASATSIAANAVTDIRQFPPNDNEIDQQSPSPPLLQGTAKLIGATSRRVTRPMRAPRAYNAYMAEVLKDSPLIYLPMLETSGTIARDYGSESSDGNYVGGVLLDQQIGSTGRYAPLLDGTTGYVQIQHCPQLVAGGPFTIEIQALALNSSDYYWFFAQGVSTGTSFKVRARPSLLPNAQIGSTIDAIATDAMSLTAINHIAITWDGTSLKFYLNGTADSGGTITPGAPTYDPTSGYADWPIFIGGADNGSTLPGIGTFPGYLRHAAVYPIDLSAARISAHAALM